MEIHEKRCFIIEFNFSNGHPVNVFEDVMGIGGGVIVAE